MRTTTNPRFSIFVPGLLLLFVASGCQQATEPVEPAAAIAPSADIEFANSECPIMGGKPSPELTAEYNGQTIGFCCDGCPQKWAGLSAEQQAEKFAAVDRQSEIDNGSAAPSP